MFYIVKFTMFCEFLHKIFFAKYIVYMFFKEWLYNLEEAQLYEMPLYRPRGPRSAPGGAFGNQTQRRDQMSNRFDTLQNRVQYGKKIEKQIRDNLRKCGFQISEPTEKEDRIDKIDGFWNRNGTREAVQIKYRDRDNDILFEVEKDYDLHTPGRDMKGKSVYYIVWTAQTKSAHIFRTEDIKNLITRMQQEVLYAGFDKNKQFIKNGVKLAIRPDPQTKIPKLLAYIPISALTTVEPPCSMDLNFSV